MTTRSAFRQLSTPARLLVLNQFGINIGFYMLLPFLASYMSTELGYGAAIVGLVLGLRNLSQQGMFLVGGTAADRIGCRPMIILGCGLRVLAFGLFALLTSLPGLIAAVVLTGLAGAFFNPAVRTYLMHEAGERRAEAFSVFNVFAHAGTLVGPLLGALLLTIDFRAVAWVACVAFAVLTVAQILVLPHREVEPQQTGVLGSWREVVTNRRFLAFTVSLSAYFGLYNQLYLMIPLEAQRVSGLSWAITLVFVVSTVIGVAGQVRITEWCRARWTSGRSVVVGLACMGLSFVPLLVASPFLVTRTGEDLGVTVALVMIPVLATTVLFTVGQAITNPFAMELLPVVGSERLAGTYYGFYYLVSSVAAAGVSWLAGTLLDLAGVAELRWLPCWRCASSDSPEPRVRGPWNAAACSAGPPRAPHPRTPTTRLLTPLTPTTPLTPAKVPGTRRVDMSRAAGDRVRPRWTRRRFLAAAAGAAAVTVLPGCAAGGAGSERFRVAFATAGGRESLDPHVTPLFVDQARAKALFDTLVAYDDDMSIVPRLAESWESGDAGRRWRITLRGARFHDGSPVTAEDVLYSYRRIADPGAGASAQTHFTPVDFAASRAHSERELELVLQAPNFEFPAAWGAPGTEIVPAGTTGFRNPVGSGPFRFSSFEPGGSAVFTRFDDHWSGPAAPAELEFVPINDESARVSALLSGQVHYAHDVGANAARRLEGDERARVLSAPHSTMQAVALKVDRAPFDDPRLREAVQLGIDREALVEVALSGKGEVGNDLFGKDLEHYADDLPQRTRDVDRARELVREAGAGRSEITLLTSDTDPYFERAATLIAEQLAEIGLTVTPQARPSETYFDEIEERGVAAHTRTAALPVPVFLGQRMTSGSESGNYTHFDSAEFDGLFSRAIATADDGDRARLLARAQHVAHVDSGLVVWGFSHWNVAVAPGVDGLRAATPNSQDWARFDGASWGERALPRAAARRRAGADRGRRHGRLRADVPAARRHGRDRGRGARHGRAGRGSACRAGAGSAVG
ncbi:MFS transporter [Saccharomonospora sp. CUA-673]|uniref:MFS transporter n=1 Tax=Saccharomonospora sp. CUA-673 TaxID=1904969 RepID=UPI00096A33D7